MVDTTLQQRRGDIVLPTPLLYRVTHDHHHDFDDNDDDDDDNFANCDFGTDVFTDVNAENARLQKFLRTEVHEITLQTPGASSSRATSYLADSASETPSRPWVPRESDLRSTTTTTAAAVDYEDVSLDDYIYGHAYDNTPIPSDDTVLPVAHTPIEQPPRTVAPTRAVLDNTVLDNDVWDESVLDNHVLNGSVLDESILHNVQAFGAPLLPIVSIDAVVPAPANPIAIVRSLSKRGRQDTSGTMSGGLTRQRSKRHKQIEGGFACEVCNESFNRACDQAKHFKRAHGGADARPHSCPDCSIAGKVKKFLYPKDVRRHRKQVHNIDTTNIGLAASEDVLEPATPTSPGPSALWTLTKAVQRFKNLRISASSPVADSADERYIMVSTDLDNFKIVVVPGDIGADALVSQILAALGLHDQDLHAQLFNCHQHGSKRLGDRLNRHRLLSLVTRAADAQGTLKLLIHPSR